MSASVSLGLTCFFGQRSSVADFLTFSLLLFSKMAIKMGQGPQNCAIGRGGWVWEWCELRSTKVWLGQFWYGAVFWCLCWIYSKYGVSGHRDFRKPSLMSQPPLGLQKFWTLLWVTATFIVWPLVNTDHSKASAVGLPCPDHGGLHNGPPPFHLNTQASQDAGTNHWQPPCLVVAARRRCCSHLKWTQCPLSQGHI